MTHPYTYGTKARITGNSNPRHGFDAGTLVTILGTPTGKPGAVYVSGKHPHKDVPFLLYAYVAMADLEPVSAEELAYLNSPAAPAPTAEDEWFDALPQAPEREPVQVLGDHYRLATDEDIERALRNLRFELAQRKEEAADV